MKPLACPQCRHAVSFVVIGGLYPFQPHSGKSAIYEILLEQLASVTRYDDNEALQTRLVGGKDDVLKQWRTANWRLWLGT
jgi:hypothetical protein